MRRLIVRSAAAGCVRHRGVSIVLVVIALVLLIGFVSLAVDIGRVRLARAELQTAADASARAGAFSLPVSNDAVWEQAADAGMENTALNADSRTGASSETGVALDPDEDIHVGIWDSSTRTFTELTDDPTTRRDDRRAANAVWTNARRLKERGNPVPLIFAPVVGVFSNNIEREAVAKVSGGPANFGFVGIDSVNSNGNKATVDSQLPGGNVRRNNGGVASDGTIDLGNADIYGDARPGLDPAAALDLGPNATVTGWTAKLDYKLAPHYPPASVPADAVTVSLPANNKMWVLPPTGITPSNDPDHPVVLRVPGISKIKSLMIMGYVKLYVTGDVNVNGNAVHNTGNPFNPAKLTIIVVGANTKVDVGGNPQQYLHLYAPQSDVTFTGTSVFYGWIVGKSLTFKGTTDLHYDESLSDHTAFKITMVK